MSAIIRNIMALLTVLVLALSFAPSAKAQEFASKEEAKAMTEKAAAFFKEKGTEAAVKAFTDPKGGFVDRDMYVVMVRMADGERLSHINPKMIGKTLFGYQDVDGRDYGNEIMDLAATKGSGWVDYKIANQVSKEISEKTSYVLRSGDYIFVVGVYKK